MAPEATVEAPQKQSEPERINAWRSLLATKAGAPPHIADLVGSTWAIDLHEFLAYLENGCDPTIAYDILKPLE